MTTKCMYCDNDLSRFETVFAVEGALYCSRDCAILKKQEDIVAAANDEATEWFEACAEEVSTRDIGIEPMRDFYWHVYSEFENITAVFKNKVDSNGHVVDTSVVGWFHGKPTALKLAKFIENGGKLV